MRVETELGRRFCGIRSACVPRYVSHLAHHHRSKLRQKHVTKEVEDLEQERLMFDMRRIEPTYPTRPIHRYEQDTIVCGHFGTTVEAA